MPFNIPVDAGGLPEAATSKDLREGTEEGLNHWKQTGYHAEYHKG